jgi:hypothetical protein
MAKQAAPAPAPESNPRRRRKKRSSGKRKGRRRNPGNPGSITYGRAAMIGAALGAVGVGIASAMSKKPLPVVSTELGSFAIDPSTTSGRAIRGAVRGAAIGAGVGLAAALVAREMGVKSIARMMNPAGPGTAIGLGAALGSVTLVGDHYMNKALAA